MFCSMTSSSGSPDPVMVLTCHEAVTALTFEDLSGRQNALLSGHLNGKIFQWCLKRQRIMHSWLAHSSSVLWIASAKTAQGDILFSQGRDGQIKVWTSTETLEWRQRGAIPSASLTFCNSCLCEVNSQILLATPTDETAQVKVYSLPKDESEELSPDHLQTSCQILQPQPTKNYGMCMKLKSCVHLNQPRLLVGYESGSLVLWDLLSSTLLSEIKLYPEPIMCLAVCPNYPLRQSTSFAIKGVCGSASSELISWSIEADQIARDHSIDVTNPGFNDASIRQDGRILVTGGWDNAGRAFTVSKLKPLAVLSYHRQSVQCVAISTDNLVALGGKDGQITIWDIYKNK